MTDSRSRIKIYDVSGKLVKDIVFRPSEDGRYRTVVLNPGVYFVRFESEDKIITKKVAVVK
ncbi:MAG: T9SS type A sorting domain-containing protein [candidate division WOR-3 bacterium]